MRVAAVLTCLAGIAYGADWVRAHRSPGATIRPGTARTVPPAPQNAIVVPVRGSGFRVRIDSAANGSRIVIRTADGGEVRVDVSGARDPRFQSDSDVLTVALHGEPATILVVVPSGMASVVIEANGREIVRLQDGRVTPAAAQREGVVVRWP
jgi:hypothetical protein